MPKITIDEKEIEISRESYEALRESLIPKKEGRFVPEMREEYFYVTVSIITNPMVCSTTWQSMHGDYYNLNSGNCFRTEKEAKKHRDKLLAIAEVTRYCYEKDYVLDCDWNDENQKKWQIRYRHESKEFIADWWTSNRYLFLLPYLKSEEACYDVIEVKKAELNLIFEIK